MTADVLFPTSAAEAASLYDDGADITVFGGGTILLPEIASGRAKPARALMLHRAGLDTLRVDDDRVVIGAMLPIAALLDAPDEALSDVARHVADREIRQSATVGGNLSASAAPDSQRGDLGAPLIALGARVRSTGAGGERLDSIEDFLAGDRDRRLVLEIEYDRFERRTGTTSLDAATPIPTPSPPSSPARGRTAPICASPSAASAPLPSVAMQSKEAATRPTC